MSRLEVLPDGRRVLRTPAAVECETIGRAGYQMYGRCWCGWMDDGAVVVAEPYGAAADDAWAVMNSRLMDHIYRAHGRPGDRS